MEEFKSILVPTDGSATSKLAVQKGLSLAKLVGAKVTAVYVAERPHYLGESFIPDPPDEEGYRKFYDNFEKLGERVVKLAREEGEKQGVEVEGRVEKGHVAERIIALSKEFDLIIMGSMGHNQLSDLLLGSTAEKVARHAECPVMIVRKKMDE